MTDEKFTFVAEGFLQRGPNQCVRLEMQVITNGIASRLLIVSDGELLAEERTIHHKAPSFFCHNLPANTDTVSGVLIRDAFLANRGCGGPLTILQELQPQLRNLQVQTGLLQGKAVIQLRGELNQDSSAGQSHPGSSARSCCLFLDAKTLWPKRLEWWCLDRFHCQRCTLEIEFRDPVVNQQLSMDECARMFSYEPPAVATPQ